MKKYPLPFNIKAVGKIIKKEKGVIENLGKKIKIKNMGGGEEYQIVGNYIHPCFYSFSWGLLVFGFLFLLVSGLHQIDIFAGYRILVIPDTGYW